MSFTPKQHDKNLFWVSVSESFQVLATKWVWQGFDEI
jgi:hypothetical protein